MKWPLLRFLEKKKHKNQQELPRGIWHSPSISLPVEGKKFNLFFSFMHSHFPTTAIHVSGLCRALQEPLMRTAATPQGSLPELCSEQSTTTHLASCHLHTAGHCWQVQLMCFGTNRSLTTSQSSAKPTKHSGGAGWFNSQWVPAATAKLKTRQWNRNWVSPYCAVIVAIKVNVSI